MSEHLFVLYHLLDCLRLIYSCTSAFRREYYILVTSSADTSGILFRSSVFFCLFMCLFCISLFLLCFQTFPYINCAVFFLVYVMDVALCYKEDSFGLVYPQSQMIILWTMASARCVLTYQRS